MTSAHLLKAYTVQYRDIQSKHHEFCAYAKDSYDARLIAMEANTYLRDHPHAIDSIRLEKACTVASL